MPMQKRMTKTSSPFDKKKGMPMKASGLPNPKKKKDVKSKK